MVLKILDEAIRQDGSASKGACLKAWGGHLDAGNNMIEKERTVFHKLFSVLHTHHDTHVPMP